MVIPVESSTDQLNGKSIFSSVANKVRSLREKVMAFFAPVEGGEFAMAIA